MGVTLKLCKNVHGICLYINCIVLSLLILFLLLIAVVAALSFHRLLIEKRKLAIVVVSLRIFGNKIQKWPPKCPLRFI